MRCVGAVAAWGHALAALLEQDVDVMLGGRLTGGLGDACGVLEEIVGLADFADCGGLALLAVGQRG